MEKVKEWNHLADTNGRLWLIVDCYHEGSENDMVWLMEVREYESFEQRNFKKLEMERFQELLKKNLFRYITPKI